MGLFRRRKVVHLPDLPPSPVSQPAPVVEPMAQRLGLCCGWASEHLPWVQDLGVKHIRVPVFYGLWQDPNYRHSVIFDAERYAKADISGVVVVHDAPTITELYRLAVDVSRYLPAGWVLQLHNEMNIETQQFRPHFYGDTVRDRGRQYGQLLIHVRANAACAVLPGGLAGDPREFLRGMLEAGPVTSVALHCYGYPPYNQMTKRVLEAREVVPDAEFYITEVGSEGGKADQWTYDSDLNGTIYTLGNQHVPVKRAYWYSLDSSDGFGLLNMTNEQKAFTTEAYNIFKRAMNG